MSWTSDNSNIPGLLWMCGGPRKGRTHLATHLTSQPRKNDMVLTCFWDTRDILRPTELAVVLGLLNRLLESEDPDDPEDLYMMISDKFHGIEQYLFSDAYIADLGDCPEKIIQERAQKRRVYLVLDGLDECGSSSRSHLTTQLRNICNKNRQEEKNGIKIAIFNCPLDLPPSSGPND